MMINAEWKPRRLDELGFVGRGKSRHRPRNDMRLYGGPHPFIQTADIMAADPYITTFSQTYSEFGLKQSKVWPPNTLCMTIAGANTARTAILKIEACFPDSVVGFIPDQTKSDLHFVKYSLDLMRHHFLSVSRGATQDNLSLDKLLSFPILAPEVNEQRRIGAILSAYDELIENSQRRIKILESITRALYREWFVHFRFPGHESVPRVPSPLGDIPQGWEVKPLFELTKVNYGKGLPKKKLADDGAYPVYGAAKIIGRFTEYTREERTIICGCRGSVGEMQITQPQCYVTNNSFTFDPKHPDNYFWLFQTLKERGLRDVVGGAAQPQITIVGISSVELITPPLPVRARFQQEVQSMFKQAWVLDSQIQNLRRIRDLLLPRLMSGQVEIKMEAA
jgi:type I restriction enzyme, S subunit